MAQKSLEGRGQGAVAVAKGREMAAGGWDTERYVYRGERLSESEDSKEEQETVCEC